jgi:hypothetical protein
MSGEVGHSSFDRELGRDDIKKASEQGEVSRGHNKMECDHEQVAPVVQPPHILSNSWDRKLFVKSEQRVQPQAIHERMDLTDHPPKLLTKQHAEKSAVESQKTYPVERDVDDHIHRKKLLYDPKSSLFVDSPQNTGTTGTASVVNTVQSSVRQKNQEPENGKWSRVWERKADQGSERPSYRKTQNQNHHQHQQQRSQVDEEAHRLEEQRKEQRNKEKFMRGPRTKGILFQFNSHGELEEFQVPSEADRLVAWEQQRLREKYRDSAIQQKQLDQNMRELEELRLEAQNLLDLGSSSLNITVENQSVDLVEPTVASIEYCENRNDPSERSHQNDCQPLTDVDVDLSNSSIDGVFPSDGPIIEETGSLVEDHLSPHPLSKDSVQQQQQQLTPHSPLLMQTQQLSMHSHHAVTVPQQQQQSYFQPTMMHHAQQQLAPQAQSPFFDSPMVAALQQQQLLMMAATNSHLVPQWQGQNDAHRLWQQQLAQTVHAQGVQVQSHSPSQAPVTGQRVEGDCDPQQQQFQQLHPALAMQQQQQQQQSQYSLNHNPSIPIMSEFYNRVINTGYPPAFMSHQQPTQMFDWQYFMDPSMFYYAATQQQQQQQQQQQPHVSQQMGQPVQQPTPSSTHQQLPSMPSVAHGYVEPLQQPQVHQSPYLMYADSRQNQPGQYYQQQAHQGSPQQAQIPHGQQQQHLSTPRGVRGSQSEDLQTQSGGRSLVDSPEVQVQTSSPYIQHSYPTSYGGQGLDGDFRGHGIGSVGRQPNNRRGQPYSQNPSVPSPGRGNGRGNFSVSNGRGIGDRGRVNVEKRCDDSSAPGDNESTTSTPTIE